MNFLPLPDEAAGHVYSTGNTCLVWDAGAPFIVVMSALVPASIIVGIEDENFSGGLQHTQKPWRFDEGNGVLSALAIQSSSGAGNRVPKGGSASRAPVEKRQYVPDHRPAGISVAEGCRLMVSSPGEFSPNRATEKPTFRCAVGTLDAA
jgi:hypothetical protein